MEKIEVPFGKLRRIIHLADIHIRLYKRHEEYRECLNQLYADLKDTDLSNTVIVVAGDIVHAKTDLSPEAVALASDFLRNLSDLAPTLVIAGNHDFNQANQNRLDSLTPIINNINSPNLHYLKYSGIYQLADVDFYVWSIIGEKSDWPEPTTDRTKICLFHGPVHNATTDVGYTVTNRHIMIENFDGFDMVLLGDIHRHQVLQQYEPVKRKPIIVYASSLIQQNHGETLKGHGWCDWDVERRSFEFRELENKWGYYTLRVENGIVPSYKDMPENVRLRIFAGSLEQSDIKKLVANIRKTHNVKELSVTNFEGIKRTSATVDIGSTLDIFNIDVQNKLIIEFLKTALPNLSQDALDRVLEINRWANDEISTEDIARNIIWNPISLKYDNLFSYGENNYIDFTKLNGILGIFAPNASGKTSIAEAICFALYDKTPRTNRAVNIMNNRKTESYCEFKFEIDGVEYTVERIGKKNKKGDVKMDVNFYRVVNGKKESLNGEQRVYTNQIIRSYVGDYEDFIITIFSSSSAQGLFVDRGQADRKDLLSQYMGLTICDRLHAVANDKIKEVAGAIKQFKNDDFTQDLVDVQKEIETVSVELSKAERELEEVNERLNELTILIQKEYEKKTPVNVTSDIASLERERDELKTKLQEVQEQIKELEKQQQEIQDKIEKGNHKLKTEYATVEEDYVQYNKIQKELEKIRSDISLKTTLKQSSEKTLQELSKHEYDPNCEFCVKNGRSTIERKTEAEQDIVKYEEALVALKAQETMLVKEIAKYGDMEDKYKKYKLGKEWIDKSLRESIRIGSKIQELEVQRNGFGEDLFYIQGDIEEYHKSIQAIEENQKIDEIIQQLEGEKISFKQKFNHYRSQVHQLGSRLAVLESKKTDMLNRIKKASELEDKYKAYEAYLATMSRDGLPYKLISEVLPSLEVEVNNLLNQMVDFTLIFETDGKNVNMKIRYEDDRIWPLEMASGMEKFVSSLAIRVALTKISSLPKSNFLIIDEGLGTLDADNLSSLFMLFEVLKTHFDFIFLISHVDSVRDLADRLIEIKRSNGFSQITIE